jgi:hypothetical protein
MTAATLDEPEEPERPERGKISLENYIAALVGKQSALAM